MEIQYQWHFIGIHHTGYTNSDEGVVNPGVYGVWLVNLAPDNLIVQLKTTTSLLSRILMSQSGRAGWQCHSRRVSENGNLLFSTDHFEA